MVHHQRTCGQLDHHCGSHCFLRAGTGFQPLFHHRFCRSQGQNRAKRQLKSCLEQKGRGLEQKGHGTDTHGGHHVVSPSHTQSGHLQDCHHHRPYHAGGQPGSSRQKPVAHGHCCSPGSGHNRTQARPSQKTEGPHADHGDVEAADSQDMGDAVSLIQTSDLAGKLRLVSQHHGPEDSPILLCTDLSQDPGGMCFQPPDGLQP